MLSNPEILKSYGSSTPLAARRRVCAFVGNVLTYGNSVAGVRPVESEGDATPCDLIIRKRGHAGIKLGSEMSLPAQCPSAGKKSYTATPRHFKFCDEKHSSARSYRLRKRTTLRTRGGDRSARKITHKFRQLLRTVFSSHLSLSDSLLEDFCRVSSALFI